MEPSPAAADADTLIARLDAAPDDVRLRERAARALADSGRDEQAAALLTGALTHFNAHDPGALPCLCRRCIGAAGARARVGDTGFRREFAVATGKRRSYVLFFWLPDDLRAQAERVRRSIASDLARRVAT